MLDDKDRQKILHIKEGCKKLVFNIFELFGTDYANSNFMDIAISGGYISNTFHEESYNCLPTSGDVDIFILSTPEARDMFIDYVSNFVKREYSHRTNIDIFAKKYSISIVDIQKYSVYGGKGISVVFKHTQYGDVFTDKVMFQLLFIDLEEYKSCAEYITETFDFEHCKAEYNFLKDTLTFHEKSLSCILNKETFFYNHLSKYPDKRKEKWKSRGYKVIDYRDYEDSIKKNEANIKQFTDIIKELT